MNYRRLSSVLKHKKPPKRGGRKGSKGDSSGLDMLGVMGEPSSATTDLTPTTRASKWSTSAKASFFAGLHPSRWGRSSYPGPDRPSPPMVSLL